jgi:hypothetical protein
MITHYSLLLRPPQAGALNSVFQPPPSPSCSLTKHRNLIAFKILELESESSYVPVFEWGQPRHADGIISKS